MQELEEMLLTLSSLVYNHLYSEEWQLVVSLDLEVLQQLQLHK